MEIYLDNAATTKPSKALLPLFSAHVESEWKNPSAMYPPAVAAERQLRAARETLAGAVHGGSCGRGVHFLRNRGSQHGYFAGIPRSRRKKLHFITSAYEHPCVYECFRALETAGHSVDYIRPRRMEKSIRRMWRRRCGRIPLW